MQTTLLPPDYAVLTLAQWHAWKQTAANTCDDLAQVTVFASLLSSQALELLYHLVHLDTHLSSKNQANLRNIRIQIVLFPISPLTPVNAFFVGHLEEMLLTLSESHFISASLDLITDCADSVNIRFRELGMQACEVSKRDLNAHLFGSLAADYLDQIKTFPVLFIGEEQYYGIPMNYSGLVDFMDWQIVPSIQTMLAHITRTLPFPLEADN